MAEQLFNKGMTVAEIARTTHHAHRTVKNYLNPLTLLSTLSLSVKKLIILIFASFKLQMQK
mgnify:CR=1 FL=1